jgi:hypothetical protein
MIGLSCYKRDSFGGAAGKRSWLPREKRLAAEKKMLTEESGFGIVSLLSQRAGSGSGKQVWSLKTK